MRFVGVADRDLDSFGWCSVHLGVHCEGVCYGGQGFKRKWKEV